MAYVLKDVLEGTTVWWFLDDVIDIPILRGATAISGSDVLAPHKCEVQCGAGL